MLEPYRSAYRSWTVVALVLVFVIGIQAFLPHASANAGLASVHALMGRGVQAPNGTVSGGDVTAVMGVAELDFRHVALPPGEELIVDVLAVMGGVIIRVPDHWTVDTRAVPVLGGARDRRFHAFDAADDAPRSGQPAPRLVLRGAVVMGGLTIRS